MIINNKFFKDDLREKWKEQKETVSVEQFCRENNIATSYFYNNVGTAYEISKETRYKKSGNKNREVCQLRKLIITPEVVKQCEDLYLSGKDFREVAEATGINEWEILGILEDKWQDRQIQNNAYSNNNLYGKSIVELIEEGFSDVSIANLFSVQMGKIRRFREGLYAK